MANIVTVRTSSGANAAAILNASVYGTGAIVRLQSSVDGAAFANEATAAIVSGTETYTIYDTNGAAATVYRARYENSGGTSVSDWSAIFPTTT